VKIVLKLCIKYILLDKIRFLWYSELY